jgi:DNA-binding transcriptional LysR family regulator
MNLQFLRTFVRVADTGSLRETASELHLSPAAVHKQMKALGQEFGLPLYTHEGRRLRLTSGAGMLLPYIRTLLAQHQAAIAAAEEWRGLRRGIVRIGAGPTICACVLPWILSCFRERHPEIDLQVETGSSAILLDSVRAGSIDLALLVGRDSPDLSRYRQHTSWNFDLVPVAPARYHPRLSTAQFANAPMILFKKGSHTEALIDAWFSACKLEPRVSMRLDNAEAIKAMVRSGLGVALLPYWCVAGDLRSGVLTGPRIPGLPLRGALVLISHPGLYLPAPVEEFVKIASTLAPEELDLIASKPAAR